MITGEATPSLALAAYAETWISGAKVVVFGSARSTLAERLVERGARLVYVYDSDAARVAEATARGRSTQVSYAPLSQAGVAMRDGVFDFAIVERLAAGAKEAEESIELLGKMLSPRGVALIAVPNPEAPARLLPTPIAQQNESLGYYELYDLVSSRFAEDSTALASGVMLGAITISKKKSLSSLAVASSTGRLKAITPPKNDTGSQALALRNESASDSIDSATPQGLLCLIATVAMSENSKTVLSAASPSKMLLKESSLPWNCRARAIDGPLSPATR